ncbi:MAG: adenylate/guanylate cyclase domain-containing protein [Desulfatiglandales bacterium]
MPYPFPSQNRNGPSGSHIGAEGYPKDAIKRMAVLFTDVLGSSSFFRSHGDIAGRRMLRKHQDLASPPILEHGGAVVKMLGDSVMAYFLDAQEALKSAIEIQERFRTHNRGKEPKDQIRIRLGVHFGDGIVEERDIFGDVVNTAAKFLPLVKGDQIVISQQVRDQVQGLPSIRLEPFEIPEGTFLPKGFTLYEVLWEEGIHFDPLVKTLVYFKPLFNLGKTGFAKAWNGLLDAKARFWGGGVETETLLEDRSVVVIVNEPVFSLTLAKRITEHLRTHLGEDAAPFLPIQILIDSGPYLRAGRIDTGALRVNWDEIKPGGVYISPPAHGLIKRSANLSIRPEPDPNRPQAFFEISLHQGQKPGSRLFLYQNVLIQGNFSPCFYCGDRRHPSSSCPSKGFTEMTHGLSRLGYRPLEEINNLFLNYINSMNQTGAPGGRSVPRGPAAADKSAQWAHEGFYELKAVYQLRFFRTLWDSRDENWNRIKERAGGSGEGGLVWIGQDCIRVSNMEQAQSILLDALNRTPQDYKVYCALAFLNIEKEDYPLAKHYLQKALNKTETTPQKILVCFLLSRLYDLGQDPGRAEEMIRKIRYLNPYCPEAVYQEIVFQFRRGRTAPALHHLIKLIKRNREYYLYALIDPELAAHSEMIHPGLKDLLEETRSEAIEITGRAKETLERIKQWLDEEDKDALEARSQWKKVEELSRVDSYFGFLDIIHFGRNIITRGLRGIEERREQLSAVLDELIERTDQYLAFVKGFQYPFLTDTIKRELVQLRARLNKDWAMSEPKKAGRFKEAFGLARALSAELDEIGPRLERLDKVRRALLFVTGFFKKSLIFQAANLLVAMILFPIMVYYLNFLVPVFSITSQNVWGYQKGVLIVGGVLGLFLAIVSTAKSMPVENGLRPDAHAKSHSISAEAS